MRWVIKSIFGYLALLARVSTLLALIATASVAHETTPAIADLTIGDRFEAEITLKADALLSGVDLERYDDLSNIPEISLYAAQRAESPEAAAGAFRTRWPELREGFLTEGLEELSLKAVEVDDQPDLQRSRDARITVSAELPAGDGPVVFGWVAAYGPMIVRLGDADDEGAYAAFLAPGELSAELPRAGIDETAGEIFVRYVIEGFEHIIPKGVDHILFVLGLFFFSLRFGPLLWQVTAFTLAHTVTLALATLEVINIPDSAMWFVEALIALSITYVAVENIFIPQLRWWRPAVVFAFGLLHGLGFASVLGDLGLAQGQFILSLIAFNIGVELGQLSVIAAAFLLLALPFGRTGYYRKLIVVPGSLAIASVGAYWFIERAFT
ncbi:MAG: HupE/UreJ family protein [Pseudomonadota bacterium]